MPQADRFRVSHRTFPSDHRRTRISLYQTAGTTALCPTSYACQAVLLLTAVLVGHADLLGYFATQTILITQRASVPGRSSLFVRDALPSKGMPSLPSHLQ
ncbi:BQ5605_C017g08368 [Microbotryum silenes-dioicae]|uniref:BQ5605_C017g08368 protein n=1 Tax=Microbotryum silenes-dioicae TaxID=796604 RepID=A0A2X0NS69_9BASI|nr:BQ5605_C017g08368 [Microbotryum silenes-dioicae]